MFEKRRNRLQKDADFIQRNWVGASTHGRALGILRKVTRELVVVDAYGIMVLRGGRVWHDLIFVPIDPST